MTIREICKKYHNKIDALDLELIIAHEIGKTREFVLAHPEHNLTKNQKLKTKNLLARRRRGEPLAYILGRKEFFGLDFKVNRHTLIPRPETELLVELAIKELQTKNYKPKTIIDVGTGSGNIITSLAHNIKHGTWNNMRFFGIDISNKALLVAKHNARKHKVDKNITFLKSDLLKNKKLSNNSTIQQCSNLIILANLPYLSKEIYNSTPRDVKNFEPKSALFSSQSGLGHYTKLLKQIKKIKSKCFMFHVSCFMEISPEQKPALTKLAAFILPGAKLEFKKDMAGKWRVCRIVF